MVTCSEHPAPAPPRFRGVTGVASTLTAVCALRKEGGVGLRRFGGRREASRRGSRAEGATCHNEQHRPLPACFIRRLEACARRRCSKHTVSASWRASSPRIMWREDWRGQCVSARVARRQLATQSRGHQLLGLRSTTVSTCVRLVSSQCHIRQGGDLLAANTDTTQSPNDMSLQSATR